jgi:hypothetical protein
MMRTLELNLASRPFRNNTPIWTAHGFLLAASSPSALGTCEPRSMRRLARSLQADIGSVERRSPSSISARRRP